MHLLLEMQNYFFFQYLRQKLRKKTDYASLWNHRDNYPSKVIDSVETHGLEKKRKFKFFFPSRSGLNQSFNKCESKEAKNAQVND